MYHFSWCSVLLPRNLFIIILICLQLWTSHSIFHRLLHVLLSISMFIFLGWACLWRTGGSSLQRSDEMLTCGNSAIQQNLETWHESVFQPYRSSCFSVFESIPFPRRVSVSWFQLWKLLENLSLPLALARIATETNGRRDMGWRQHCQLVRTIGHFLHCNFTLTGDPSALNHLCRCTVFAFQLHSL